MKRKRVAANMDLNWMRVSRRVNDHRGERGVVASMTPKLPNAKDRMNLSKGSQPRF
jgi:hypothetical protein